MEDVVKAAVSAAVQILGWFVTALIIGLLWKPLTPVFMLGYTWFGWWP